MTDLPKRELGRTGFEVTTLGFEAMELRGLPRGPELTEREAEQISRGAPDDWQRTYYMVPGSTLQDRWEQAKLDELLYGLNRIEFTLRFTLSHPALHTTIVGTRNLEHLRANIEAAEKGPLPADIVAEAKRRLDRIGAASQPV